MIHATHAKSHRTVSSPPVHKGWHGQLIGRTTDGLNSKLHVPADAKGRPSGMYLSAGQTFDYVKASASGRIRSGRRAGGDPAGDGHIETALNQLHVGGHRADHEPKHAPGMISREGSIASRAAQTEPSTKPAVGRHIPYTA